MHLPLLMADWLIPVILVAVFGVIVIAVILIRRHVSFFKSDEKPKDQNEIAKEELDRLLEPVEEMKPSEDEEEESEAKVNTETEDEKKSGE